MAVVNAPSPALIERGKSGAPPLCHVSPSLTLYLKDPPTGDQALAALGVYRGFCPIDRQKLVTGSRAPAFTKVGEAMGKRILSSHLDLMNRRKDIGIALWDGERQESWHFNLTGVPPDGVKPRASFCRVTFPNSVDSALISELATAMAEQLPYLSGHGGLTAHFDADFKVDAFNRIFVWAKRYPGLEVEDLNVTLHHVVDAIKGAGWLTLVGNDLFNRLKTMTKGGPKLPSEVTAAQSKHGLVLRAGPAPVLGDRNAVSLPVLQAEVERALLPIKLKEHGEFVGRFEEEQATMPWLYRLVTPEGWLW